jgi:hypothetical protein
LRTLYFLPFNLYLSPRSYELTCPTNCLSYEPSSMGNVDSTSCNLLLRWAYEIPWYLRQTQNLPLYFLELLINNGQYKQEADAPLMMGFASPKLKYTNHFRLRTRKRWTNSDTLISYCPTPKCIHWQFVSNFFRYSISQTRWPIWKYIQVCNAVIITISKFIRIVARDPLKNSISKSMQR